MILKAALASVTLTLALSSTASAHSAYWHCAVASGSVEATQANCGSRADFDRTGELGGANAPTEADRQARRMEEERQRQDQIRREDDERRDRLEREDRERRDRLEREEQDRRRRLDEEESQRRNSRHTPSYEEPSYERPARRGQQPTRRNRVAEQPVEAPVYEDMVIPVEINTQAASINVGVAANLDAYPGYRIKAIKVESVTSGNSRVNVLVGGTRVGSIIAQQPGEYEKDFRSSFRINRAARNLVLTTQGDVTVQRVTILIGR